MLKNPNWLDAGKFAPQWYKHPAPRPLDKTAVFHSYPTPATAAQMKAAGAGAVWENNRNGLDIPGAHNFSTIIFGSSSPTEQTVRNAARGVQIVAGMIVTDEFAEGTFPQDNQQQTRTWFYSELGIMAAEQGKTIKLRGEYGSGAVNTYKEWKRNWNTDPEPMSAYMLSLVQPGVVATMDTPGNLLKAFAQSPQAATWGRVVSYYESQERDIQQVMSAFPFQAILQYNAVPNAPTLLFTWYGMQSNGVMIDVPQRDAGSIKPNGQTVYQFPHRAPEISKMFACLGLLFYEDVYLWADNGTQPDDDNAPGLLFPAISIDAFKVGVDWYAELIPSLNQAGRELLVSNYTADGAAFNYAGAEKRISRLGHAYYGNSYFNQAAAARMPWLIKIPSTVPRYIYLDPWNTPLVGRRVVADGIDFGTIPGMTLFVA